MSHPLDRTCDLPELGELDRASGEFWPESMFAMPEEKRNLSSYERNRAFLNLGEDGFLDFSYASTTDLDSDSRSVVAADFDRDGRTDLLVGSVGGGPLRLFRNEFPDDQHRVRIELVGVESNRRGIGARVIAFCGERQIVRDVFPVNTCLSQTPPEILLGTADAEVIDRLVVRWPTGKTQEFEKLPAKGVLTITEGQERTAHSESWVSKR